MVLDDEIDMSVVNKAVDVYEKELKFPNTLMWGNYTVKHPNNITVTLYDYDKEMTTVRFLNRNRALIFTGKKRGLTFKGSIDKRSLILLNEDYEIDFENLLESIYRTDVNHYKYDINIGSLDLKNLIFSDARTIIEFNNAALDDRINTFIDLRYVQDMYLHVMVIIWLVLPDVLQEIKTHLQIGYKEPKDFLEQLKSIQNNKKKPPSSN